MNIIFFIIGLLWIIVSQRVKYWAVISALGFKMETPLLFLRKDYIYFAVSHILFIATTILSFFQTILPTWIGIIIILIIGQIIKVHAQCLGCSKYRSILHEMKDKEIAFNEDTSFIDKELEKTNSELLSDARERAK